jgi:hypothetical protein
VPSVVTPEPARAGGKWNCCRATGPVAVAVDERLADWADTCPGDAIRLHRRTLARMCSAAMDVFVAPEVGSHGVGVCLRGRWQCDAWV